MLHILTFTFLLLMLSNLLTRLIGPLWTVYCPVLGFLAGFVMLTLNTMLMFGCVSSLQPALVSPGLVMGVFPRFVPSVWCSLSLCICPGVGILLLRLVFSLRPDLLFSAARFTTQYVRLVGQEAAPSKCVLLSTSREVRRDTRDWVLSPGGDKWTVKFDVRDLGGHLDTTFRGWSSSTSAARFVLLFLDFLFFLFFLLIFMVGCELLGRCICLLLCMVLRPLFFT